ncbi:ABC transporter substrate-binding protein [Acuticoccus mangrovi]|uniref:ABC transporter substrate-binding protein n=1 Tax=Acuticoccus mangrovi TaxID=2796142 RepID=UPI001B3B862D
MAFAGALAASAASAADDLTISYTVTPDTLDPAKMKTGVEYAYSLLVFNGLTGYDDQLNVVPDLAESWSASDDLKTWTFKLRDDVTWHDGRPFVAEDVLATMKRMLDPEVGSRMRVNFELIEDMSAPDEHTVVFNLKLPYSTFPALFGGYQARIVPYDHIDTLTTHPIGTGAFKFVEYLPGDRLVMEKNPDYFVEGQPKLDKVTMRIIPEFATATAALEAGEVDIVWDIPPEEQEKLASSSVAHVDFVPTGSWHGIIMHNEKEPFTDKKVRQAVYALIDKPLFAEIAMFGAATPTHSPIPPTSPYFDKDIPIGTADVEKAKALLAEAGFPNGFEQTIYVPAESSAMERLAVSFRDAARQAGITIDIQPIPSDRFFSEYEGKVPLFTTNFYGRTTMDTMLYPWLHSSGSWNNNLWHFSNPEMDKILDDARITTDEETLAGFYKRVQEIVVEDVPGVVVYQLNHANGVHERVEGFKSSPLMWPDLRGVSLKN